MCTWQSLRWHSAKSGVECFSTGGCLSACIICCIMACEMQAVLSLPHHFKLLQPCLATVPGSAELQAPDLQTARASKTNAESCRSLGGTLNSLYLLLAQNVTPGSLVCICLYRQCSRDHLLAQPLISYTANVRCQQDITAPINGTSSYSSEEVSYRCSTVP